ncbi:MAG TPA: cation diffusion facilitator family transporter [Candidatus Limnocylindrales bacterium]|nr:cation diffusion facilitator family transporter [Candidatus Limnocylindrales bacterium]
MAHSHSAAGRHAGSLRSALAILGGLLVLELVAGLAANSLALLADAGHVFADVSGMVLSLVAIRVATRPPSGGRSFGLYRLEMLAAAINAVLLLGIAVVVLVEALRRLAAPPEVQPGLVIVAAALALGANIVALRLLSTGQRESLTMRGAYLEVAGDLLGAGAVLVAGVVIALTGWHPADAIASIVVAVLIVPRTVRLLRDSIDVLLEATPKDVDLGDVERHIREAPGVVDVHDLHAWTITSGMNVVSAHVVLGPDGRPGDILDHLGTCLADDFDVNHSTFQLETPEHVLWEARAEQAQH